MCETGIKGSVSQVASSEKLLACEKGASREKRKLYNGYCYARTTMHNEHYEHFWVLRPKTYRKH